MEREPGDLSELEQLEQEWEQICSQARIGFGKDAPLPDSTWASLQPVCFGLLAVGQLLAGIGSHGDVFGSLMFFGAGLSLTLAAWSFRSRRIFVSVRASFDRRRHELIAGVSGSE